jgi:hypothetical protein
MIMRAVDIAARAKSAHSSNGSDAADRNSRSRGGGGNERRSGGASTVQQRGRSATQCRSMAAAREQHGGDRAGALSAAAQGRAAAGRRDTVGEGPCDSPRQNGVSVTDVLSSSAARVCPWGLLWLSAVAAAAGLPCRPPRRQRGARGS